MTIHNARVRLLDGDGKTVDERYVYAPRPFATGDLLNLPAGTFRVVDAWFIYESYTEAPETFAIAVPFRQTPGRYTTEAS